MFLVECFNDETVLRALGVPKKNVRRMKGKANVIGHLKKDLHRNDVGMVDRDVKSPNPASLGPFTLAEAAHDAVLYTWKGQRLVVVEDNIEDWIAKALQASGLKLSDYTPATNAAELNRLESRVCEPGLMKAMDALGANRSAHLATLKRYLGITGTNAKPP